MRQAINASREAATRLLRAYKRAAALAQEETPSSLVRACR
jgi:hypothetical protein